MMTTQTNEPCIIQSAFHLDGGKGQRIIIYTGSQGIISYGCDENWKPYKKPYATMPAGEYKGSWKNYHIGLRGRHNPEDFVPEHSTPLSPIEQTEAQSKELSIEEITKEGLKYLEDKYGKSGLELPDLNGGSEFVDFAMGLQIGHDIAVLKCDHPQEKLSETILRNTYTNQKGVTITDLPEPQEAKQRTAEEYIVTTWGEPWLKNDWNAGDVIEALEEYRHEGLPILRDEHAHLLMSLGYERDKSFILVDEYLNSRLK